MTPRSLRQIRALILDQIPDCAAGRALRVQRDVGPVGVVPNLSHQSTRIDKISRVATANRFMSYVYEAVPVFGENRDTFTNWQEIWWISGREVGLSNHEAELASGHMIEFRWTRKVIAGRVELGNRKVDVKA
jgi:hypothetical protein